MKQSAIQREFERQGRYWFRGALSAHALSILDAATNLSGKPGERLALSADLKLALSGDSDLEKNMQVFGNDLIPARIVAFNKTAGNNWAVPWHQDRVIAVAHRHDVAGFSNWTHKGREWHCEPPRELLDQMYFLRVHLDDNAAADGTMRIALGSHTGGYVPAAEARAEAERHQQEDCVARRGDVLVLKMLTLHASSSSETTNPRRVFRVDYAPAAMLPKPLEWL